MISRKSQLRAFLAAFALSALSLSASQRAIALPEHNVPGGVAIASDQGRVDASRELNLTVLLKLHNAAEFDKVVEDLYDPASSTRLTWPHGSRFSRDCHTRWK